MIFEDILSLFHQCKIEKEVMNICDALVYNHLKRFYYDKTAQKFIEVRKKSKFLSIPQELNLEKVIKKNPLFCFYDSAVKSFRRSNRIKDTKRTQIDIFIEKLNIIGENDTILPLKIVYNLPEKNRGIVTTKNISQGDFVVEYAGELIDDKTASIRELQYTYENYKGCFMYFFHFNEKKYCIDATIENGRYGRLINHSRQNANLKTKVILYNGLPRLILIAKFD